jgi:hypothetical protein
MSTTRILLFAAGCAAAAALPVSGSAQVKAFNGNLCTTASKAALNQLKVSGPCVHSTTSKVNSTPVGSVRSVIYQARWGSLGTLEAPTHHVTAEVIDVRGSAAAVAYAAKFFRGEVLSNGIPVATKPLTTEIGDTAACHNPPTGDCTKAEVMAIVGQRGLIVVYHGPAKFVAADDPQYPAVDEANDRAQEETVKGPLTAFASSITAAL